ncbi:disease resistance protein RPV1-like [Rosa rugosa]|uniref:disease resistance protein RPV1-like n=1 Tax=Rosa rugosa TaxID=74645 RepID=UPI002B408355|nr:disease resistance protein RPV1-like [Rosa rugosa]XP_061992741.1 disease resistance protein RPV1-like [Rosa rugosa]XP_061992742.1 disease resistance protein RPV1-like [Rosa rugosa]XP_061992743.1 disease resistance protein RPV1-like [Rosa rugosa]XP_061992744.1 disease resistance protein RPV1-like [Rosa rugosa]XP_061992745.1 disease resistance protein RPV1-like [Rosa rugosa]XP_061992747.1 disease resistance protein RPV1-like [Rosa rugosa]XP_061992748.1 disease resistance protein RPV1-like [
MEQISKQNMASLTNEAAASSSSSSLPRSSTDQNHYIYEVFLSFRGEDTRFTFTDHLHTALDDRGIKTFIDEELRRGEEISPALLKAIEESRVSIIVFSQNYASSRWCLDELVKILECRKSKRQEVRPIFYKVDPSDVRHQTGAFGDAFAELDQYKYKDSMEKWKAALAEAVNLSGWPFKDGESEAKLIKRIVGDLSAQVINPSCELHVAEHPIGLESCRQDVNNLIDVEENNMVGIWGPGGIGKTTIAKDVFNSIRHKFEGSCFLADVRSNGLAQLQETLLFDILRDSTLKVPNVDVGVSLIKKKMRHKKVLLILDDVSDSSQLQKLVPSPDCFRSGSRILITTRDKRWLIAHEVDEVYEVKMLNDRHALELFSLHAFRRNGPLSNYLELAQRVVRYAQGLPLALIVLGSHLFRRSIEEWKAIIGSCKGGLQTEIQDVLRLSYDALGADLKELFLDIACFFKGEQVDHVKPILEACYGLKSVSGIPQLEEKALIRIDKDAWRGCRIWMHDLIEEMGKDIVHQESHVEPGKRSRVWKREDVDHILTNNTGTKTVLGIQVPWRERSSTISLNAKSFLEMKNLRYISMGKDLEYEPFSGDIDYLSNQLRWLDWPDSPLRSFPSDFYANKLVKLNIPNSRRITRLWERHKNFSRLTCMNLRGCESLKELPDFSGIPNLKELDLYECTRLVEVPDSLRLLDNLVTLNVDHCKNLIRFPRKINFKSAKTIYIRYCKLEEFSEVGKEMGFLRSLDLSGTCIKELHPSITMLIGLEELNLQNCKNLTTLPYNIYELRNLKFLDARDCPKLATFPEIPLKMDSLRLLSLSGSDIRELDHSIGNLIGLEVLDLTGCKNLTTLPCSIYALQNLQTLSLFDCSELVRFPRITDILNVDGCPLSLPKLLWFHIGGCRLSDCDFLVTLDCWDTLIWLDLSRNNFVSLPACITKFVNLKILGLYGCKRLREIPELPPNVHIDTSGCELLEERFSTLTNPGAVIEAESPSFEFDDEEESTPSLWPAFFVFRNSETTPQRGRTITG